MLLGQLSSLSEVESHTAFWAVGSLQLAERGDARPRPGAHEAVSRHGERKQTQASLPRTACRRHAGRQWRRIIVACRQERETSGIWATEHSKASDRERADVKINYKAYP